MQTRNSLSPKGFELKAEYISAINKYASLSVFAYYQALKARGLSEQNNKEPSETFNSGYARIESLGLGIAYRF
jgi:hypothetical protein